MANKKSAKSTKNASRSHGFLHGLRLFLIGLLVTLSCLGVAAYVAVHWVESQILNTDSWVSFVTPLPKQPVIYNALGTYIGNTLYNAVPVEQEIADALPPRASFLASPLADQVHKLAIQGSTKAVSSDAFQTVWVGANRYAMNQLLLNSRNPEANTSSKINQLFNLDLSSGSGAIKDKLGSIAPSLFDNSNGGAKKISLIANLKTKREQLHSYVRAVDFANAVLPAFIVATVLGALAFTKTHRRRVTMIFAGGVTVLSLMQVIGVKALRPEILNQIQNSAFKPAVGYVYDTLLATFNSDVYMVLTAAVILFVICIFVGNAPWAVKLHGFLQVKKLEESKPMQWWHQLRNYANKYKYVSWMAAVAIGLLYLAFYGTVNWTTATNTTLVILSLLACIQILATSPTQKLSIK